MKILMAYFFVLLSMCSTAYGSDIDKKENLVIMLSSKLSGTNLIRSSLFAIVRKPITKFSGTICHLHLELPLVSSTPFLYHSHTPKPLYSLSSKSNKLILVTRNPKELLFRHFSISSIKDLQTPEVKIFIERYLNRFKLYESWDNASRFLVFYEDYIMQENEEILLKLLDFIGEEPTYFDDYINHKEDYSNKILSSYKNLYNDRGSSSVNGPKRIFYTKDIDPKLLNYADYILQKNEPLIWEKYLKRFETTKDYFGKPKFIKSRNF